MRNAFFLHRLLACCVMASSLLLGAGCNDDNDEPTGTAIVQGTVESFDASGVVVARLNAAVQGVTVYIEGPVTRRTATDENGRFVFSNLPAGEYSLRFEYNGEEVTYRGNSGQAVTLTLADDQAMELTDVRIAGGEVNIGRISVVNLAESDTVPDTTPDEDSSPDDVREADGETNAQEQAGDDVDQAGDTGETAPRSLSFTVLNTPVGIVESVHELVRSEEEWDRLYATNTRAYFYEEGLPPPSCPDGVDFTREMLVVITSGGERRLGWDIESMAVVSNMLKVSSIYYVVPDLVTIDDFPVYGSLVVKTERVDNVEAVFTSMTEVLTMSQYYALFSHVREPRRQD